MKVDVSLNVGELTKLVERFPAATAAQLADFTGKVGRKIEREAKVAMRADVAGPDQARSRTGGGGGLVGHIRFVMGGKFSGVVKSFVNYSQYVHGPPFHRLIPKKGGGFRKTNPFFTTALASSEMFITDQSNKIISGIIKRI